MQIQKCLSASLAQKWESSHWYWGDLSESSSAPRFSLQCCQSFLFSVFLFQVTSSVPLFPNLFCWSSSEGSLVLRSSFWEQRSKAGCKVGWSQPHQSITVLCLQVQANGCKKMCHLWLSAAQYQRNIYACYIFRSTSESKAHLPVFSLGRSSIVLLNHDFFWSSWRHLNKCENLHTSVFQRCLLD